jgi:hypothetical protein
VCVNGAATTIPIFLSAAAGKDAGWCIPKRSIDWLLPIVVSAGFPSAKGGREVDCSTGGID